jgi:hypothetical protein
MEFYHVDRLGTIEQYVGKSVTVIDNSNNSLTGIFQHISHHGEGYIFRSDMIAEMKNNQGSTLQEFFYELVRLKKYSHRISRFEAAFAFETYEDACAFAQGEYPIYRISAENYSLHDMNWFNETSVPQGSTLQATFLWNASGYWMGMKTEDPCMEALIAWEFDVLERLD